MIIKSMDFSNFRQFYGDHHIEFGDGKNNVTLIIGANGNGKTGIFRALMFVLYGSETLDQDQDTSDINLVNTAKLDEQIGFPVEAKVELVFEYDNKDYLIKRSLKAIKDRSGRVDRQVDAPSLFKYTRMGDFTPYYDQPIEDFVHQIIEPEIREFFFFDAERMQLLDTTKNDKELSREVQEGIISLLQIKYLEESVEEVEKLTRRKQREINNQIQDETIDHKIIERDRFRDEIQVLEEKVRNYRNEKRELNSENDQIEEKLSSNKDIKELQDNKQQAGVVLSSKLETRNLRKEKVLNQIMQSTKFLARDILGRNEVDFREIVESSSDKVSKFILEESLENKECAVCRTRLKEDSDQLLIIQKLFNDYKSSELTDIITKVLEVSRNVDERKDKYEAEVRESIEKLSLNLQEIEATELEIERIDDKIGKRATNIENLNALENRLVENKSYESNLNEKLAAAQSQQNNLEKQTKLLNHQIDKLSSQYESTRKNMTIKTILEEIKETLESTVSEYSQTVTKTLSEEIYTIFMQLLDLKDRENYGEVRIDENFRIQLLNKYGQNVVQDLSMGQGQIFSLAFILSLAKIASKGRTEINFPLFIDTPFARLSRENRNNLITNIPNLTNQWILLLTDTEFTSAEKAVFMEENRVDKIYLLNNYEGKTTIQEFADLDSFKMEVYE